MKKLYPDAVAALDGLLADERSAAVRGHDQRLAGVEGVERDRQRLSGGQNVVRQAEGHGGPSDDLRQRRGVGHARRVGNAQVVLVGRAGVNRNLPKPVTVVATLVTARPSSSTSILST